MFCWRGQFVVCWGFSKIEQYDSLHCTMEMHICNFPFPGSEKEIAKSTVICKRLRKGNR